MDDVIHMWITLWITFSTVVEKPVDNLVEPSTIRRPPGG